MPTPDQVEHDVISSILESKSTSAASDLLISKEDFTIYGEVAEFIFKYNKKYGNIPSVEIVKERFKDFDCESSTKDDINYTIDIWKQHCARRNVAKVINKAQDMNDENPYAAAEYVMSKLSNINVTRKPSRGFADKDALKRYDEVADRKDLISKGIHVGTRTGLKVIDDTLLGWKDGDYVILIGCQGVGKTWLLLKMCIAAYFDNKRILYLSPEMPRSEVHLRWDTIAAPYLGMEFSHESLMTGKNLDLVLYKQWLDGVSKRKDWITYDSIMGSSITAPEVAALIDQHHPDVIGIDGIPYLSTQDGQQSMDWQSIQVTSTALKNVGMGKKVIIIATTHAPGDIQSTIDEPPTLNQVSFAKSLTNPADVVITMSGDSKSAEFRWIRIPKFRNQKNMNKKSRIHFDVDSGKICD